MNGIHTWVMLAIIGLVASTALGLAIAALAVALTA